MNMYLQHSVKVVAFHSYRKAWVQKSTLVVQDKEDFKAIQDQLVKNARDNGIKAETDNHTVFVTDSGMSFAFSDWKIYIGIGSEPR